MNFMAVKNKKKEKIAGLVIYSYNKKHGGFTAVNRDLTKYVKLELFVIINRRYTKGIPLPSKLAYERVKGWTSGRSLPV